MDRNFGLYMGFQDVTVDPSRHMFCSLVGKVFLGTYKFWCSHAIPCQSTCPHVGDNCYPSYCMRTYTCDFHHTWDILVIFNTHVRGLQDETNGALLDTRPLLSVHILSSTFPLWHCQPPLVGVEVSWRELFFCKFACLLLLTHRAHQERNFSTVYYWCTLA